jgi:oxygen-dependent protoporphyrinogen oxidase
MIVAQSAPAAADYLGDHLGTLAGELRRVTYAPLTIAHVAAPAEAFRRDLEGFGFLVPRGRGLRLLGSIWSSAMFAGRAPAGHHLLTCFLGGQLDPDATTLDDRALADLLQDELGRVFQLGASLEMTLVNVVRWERALPLYLTGYPTLARAIRESCPPWLRLVGNYLEAISVPDCVHAAQVTADALADSLALPGDSPADAISRPPAAAAAEAAPALVP